MREFYVNGFKRKNEFDSKSSRTYDDEKRRMESILGDYMCFRRNADGKTSFISIDCRITHHNPLYKALKAKSFTDGDIVLHFIIMDLLKDHENGLTLDEIIDGIYNLLPDADNLYDESTIRKKLKEYVSEGLIESRKDGRKLKYYLCEITDISQISDALDYFSEVSPCGVVGSFLLDKIPSHESMFCFKHHYITSALDSEILSELLDAIESSEKVRISVTTRKKTEFTIEIIPLRIMISVQNGRQYVMGYTEENEIKSYRIDQINSVEKTAIVEGIEIYRKYLEETLKHTWGVATLNRGKKTLEHVDFTITFDDNEKFIPRRLEREKQCGTVERINKNTYRFSADVYDTRELIPWIRSFICRITEINFSDKTLEAQFYNDLNETYKLYGLSEGGTDNALQ